MGFRTFPTQTPEQQELMQQLMDWAGGQIGQGVTPWGPTTPLSTQFPSAGFEGAQTPMAQATPQQTAQAPTQLAAGMLPDLYRMVERGELEQKHLGRYGTPTGGAQYIQKGPHRGMYMIPWENPEAASGLANIADLQNLYTAEGNLAHGGTAFDPTPFMPQAPLAEAVGKPGAPVPQQEVKATMGAVGGEIPGRQQYTPGQAEEMFYTAPMSEQERQLQELTMQAAQGLSPDYMEQMFAEAYEPRLQRFEEEARAKAREAAIASGDIFSGGVGRAVGDVGQQFGELKAGMLADMISKGQEYGRAALPLAAEMGALPRELRQQEIGSRFGEFLRTQPGANPALNLALQLANIQTMGGYQKEKDSGLGGLLGGIGSILGGLPFGG